MREQWENGKPSQASVPKTAWAALGFTDSMAIDEAKARAKNLNQLNSIKRKEQLKIQSIAERVERDRLHHSAFIPKALNEAFLKWLGDNIAGSEAHMTRVRFMWETAKKIAIQLELTPEQYAPNKKRIYAYFAAQEYSLDYTQKVIRVMNMYGEYASRLIGKFFEKVPSPHGHDRELINDSYFDSDTYFGPSEPLTDAWLKAKQDKLRAENYNWLHCTLWLGLRPSELDMIFEEPSRWRVEEGEPSVLWVYQKKLSSKPRHLRWKPIPLLYPEQLKALEIIRQTRAAKPLTKTLKACFGKQVTLYAGRKGFTDLMLEKGQGLEDIAQWMGHSSIEMTWTRYKNKRRVGFKPA
jgi:hypothetical protein